jgi:shikimate 5-dehydrogenase
MHEKFMHIYAPWKSKTDFLRNEKNNGNSVIKGLQITEFQLNKKTELVWQKKPKISNDCVATH